MGALVPIPLQQWGGERGEGGQSLAAMIELPPFKTCSECTTFGDNLTSQLHGFSWAKIKGRKTIWSDKPGFVSADQTVFLPLLPIIFQFSLVRRKS